MMTLADPAGLTYLTSYRFMSYELLSTWIMSYLTFGRALYFGPIRSARFLRASRALLLFLFAAMIARGVLAHANP